MTAPDAVPSGTSVDELAAALARGAEGDNARDAAVELLTAHHSAGSPGHWLRRPRFLARVSWYPADDVYATAAAVDWTAVRELLVSGEGLYDSPSERAVLGVAVELAIGPLYEAAASCDPHNSALIVEAVAHAFRVGVR